MEMKTMMNPVRTLRKRKRIVKKEKKGEETFTRLQKLTLSS
jgi:hypothetical protein